MKMDSKTHLKMDSKFHLNQELKKVSRDVMVFGVGYLKFTLKKQKICRRRVDPMFVFEREDEWTRMGREGR